MSISTNAVFPQGFSEWKGLTNNVSNTIMQEMDYEFSHFLQL